ncbi:helix-turn-helix transcriptional regulator [Methylorubrum rhodesianum]|uniref:helix-turn-helix transcriptional regulator n=1 Tax=Methylorubrum rhodesianum TaxID=29427 RepID=UPI003D15E8B9
MTHPLRQYREDNGLTAETLASSLGCSKATISRIETGDQQPSPDLAKAIRDATGVPLWSLRPDIWDAPSEPRSAA